MMRVSVLLLAALVGCGANQSPDAGMPDASHVLAISAPNIAAKAAAPSIARPMAALVRTSPLTTPDTYACRSGTSGIKNCGTPLQAPLGGLGYSADATAPTDGQGQVYDSMSGAYKLKTIVTSPITGTITANQGIGAGAAGPWSCELSDGSAFYTSAKTGQFPSALVGGRLDVNVGAAVLPTGAAIAAKQPAIGTAGTASADVLSIQGVAGGTPVPVSGSFTPSGTQAVSQAAASSVDGHDVTVGTTTDLSSADTLVGILKAIKAAVQGTLVADVSDRAARLLGVVYGSQGQQIKQTATNFNAAVELFTGGTAYDARQIRTLTSADTVTIVPSGTQTVSGTVTANVGTTNGLALDATVSGLQVAQASTTSGESGPMCQGATTTASPTYTTGKTNPLSLTTAGALRVDGSAVTQPISGTVTVTPSGTQAVSSAASSFADGHDLTLGSTSDANTATTVIGRLQKLVALLGGGLPSALVGGRLDVNIGSGTVTVTPSGTQTVSGTVTANQGTGAAASAPWSAQLSDGATAYTGAKTGQLPSALGQQTLAASLSIGINSSQIGTAASPSLAILGVQGAITPGSAMTGNAVTIGGSDGTVARTMLLDTTGRIPGSSFKYVSTATTTTHKSGAGVARRIIVGSNITSASIVLYDNTAASGTVIVGIVSGNTGVVPVAIEINAAFSTGLTSITTGSGIGFTIVWD